MTSAQGSYINTTGYSYDGHINTLILGATGKRVKQTMSIDSATRRLNTSTLAAETATVDTYSTKFADSYTYDWAGNIKSVAGTTNGVADQEECFRYDHLRRLTEAWTQTSGTCTTPQRTGADPYWRQWSFDSVGNRLTQKDKDTTDTTWTYTVGAAGSVKPHQVKKVDATGPKAGTGLRSFGYDTAGNTTSRTTDSGVAQTLTWDKEGHLATLTEGSLTTSYVYNSGGGRLIAKNTNKSILYLSDGTELEKIGAANPLGQRYYNGIAIRNASGLKWLTGNHQGTLTAQIDAVTLAITARRSMPYGEARGAQPALLGTKGFVGGTRDDSGLTHLGAREYDPTIGRFISVDPIMDLADPQQWNAYAYSHNSPVTFSDPSGLRDCDFASCDSYGNNASSGPDYGKPSGGKPGGGRYDEQTQSERESTWASEQERQRQLAEQRAREEAERRRQELSRTTAFDIFRSWLTGKGRRSYSFQAGDIYTEQMRNHWYMSSIRSDISGSLGSGRQKGSTNYSLSGVKGIANYARDAASGNGSGFVTGSYQLEWEVIGRGADGSYQVRMQLSNSMTLQSGTRPPVIGYTDWWTAGPGKAINEAVATGPMSAVTMQATWTETFYVD